MCIRDRIEVAQQLFDVGIEYLSSHPRLAIEVHDIEIATELAFPKVYPGNRAAVEVRHTHVDQPAHPTRVQLGETPGDDGAPVVADEYRIVVTEMIEQTHKVTTERRHVVVLDIAGLAATGVAALIRDDDMVACVNSVSYTHLTLPTIYSV